MKDELAARYKNYSIAQLLEVLENKGGYTSIAIEVAQSEWESRSVTPEQLATAKQDLEKKRLRESRQQDPLTVIAKKAGNMLARMYHDINPTTHKNPQNAIVLICGFLGLNLLYYLVSEGSFLLFMLRSVDTWDFSTALYFLPAVFMPGMIYYFYKRSPVGWTMLSIWLTYILLSTVYAFVFELTLPVPVEYDDDSGILGLLNDISPRRGLSYYTFSLLIFGGMLYYINTNPIKDIFSLNRWLPIVSIIPTALIVTIQWLPLLTLIPSR